VVIYGAAGIGGEQSPSNANGFSPNERTNVMKNLLLAAAVATLALATAPAFASAVSDAEDGYAGYPSVGSCHFVKEPVTMQNGRVVYREVQVCS
jgi:hypothetical protein